MLCCGGLKVCILTQSLSGVVMMLNFSELNKLVKKLDRRIAKSPQQGMIQSKKRIASTPSASEAPAVCKEVQILWNCSFSFSIGFRLCD